MKTLILKFEYDGTNYCGTQIQNSVPTIQRVIQDNFEKLTKTKINLISAGRTDSGVHARGQVGHSLLQDDFKFPEEKITTALNAYLPEDIRIHFSKIIYYPFHSRYDAIAREYSYNITLKKTVFYLKFYTYIKYKLDFELLRNCSELFVGEKDFRSEERRVGKECRYRW